MIVALSGDISFTIWGSSVLAPPPFGGRSTRWLMLPNGFISGCAALSVPVSSLASICWRVQPPPFIAVCLPFLSHSVTAVALSQSHASQGDHGSERDSTHRVDDIRFSRGSEGRLDRVVTAPATECDDARGDPLLASRGPVMDLFTTIRGYCLITT